MWKKRLGQWNTKDRKPPVIGKPHLETTTLDDGLLARLPTTQQAQSERYEAPQREESPRITSTFMKELPPLDLSVLPIDLMGGCVSLTRTSQVTHEQPRDEQLQNGSYRPTSEIPSASSIYTRWTPEMRHDFDPSSTVPPLFADGRYHSTKGDDSNGQGRSQLPKMDSSSTLRPTDMQNSRQLSNSGLGVSTYAPQAWQGASGATSLMTPIAATPITATLAGTGSSLNVSPVDKEMSSQGSFRGNGSLRGDGADQYPSPTSLKDGRGQEMALAPAAEFQTPTQQMSASASEPDWQDGVSIGYDVSPWSTPSSRPYYGSVLDGSTPGRDSMSSRNPGRTPSYRHRRSMSSSPAYRRTAAMNRMSIATRTTENDNQTVFEVSEPPTSRPVFDVWAKDRAAHAKRKDDPVTPPTQQGPYRKPMYSVWPPVANNHANASAYTQLRVGTFDGPVPAAKNAATPPYSGPLNDVTPPRVSHFSWDTQGTGTTFTDLNGTPERGGPSNKFDNSTTTPGAPSAAQTPILYAPPSPDLDTPPSPVMTRRRPIPTSPHLDSEREHPALARVPNNAVPFIKRKPTPSTLTAPPEPHEKALPTTPAEQSTHDYITSLSAQLSSLSHRKHNLLKMAQAHEVVSFGPMANPMVVTLEQRRRTKEKIKEIEEELSEVRRQEHETGLKLLKAEKRRDQEKPTALWIRRVTE